MTKIRNTFWNLKLEDFEAVDSQDDFYKMLRTAHKGLKNFAYKPLNLIPKDKNESNIKDIQFSNCNFAYTSFENLHFYNCEFYNCKFNHSKFINCKFHDCSFVYVNMFNVEVKNTYIDPDFFKRIIPNYWDFICAIKNANVCVTFFQTLLNNAKDTGQNELEKNADYHFKKWKGLNYIQRKFIKSQYLEKISWKLFLWKFPQNLFQYLVTGYGYGIWNFIITFNVGFWFFYYTNRKNWIFYCLKQKDVLIDNFNSNLYDSSVNFYYTLESTTILIDSQIQPTSDLGMNWLVAQGIFGFILLNASISIVLNKFVK